MDALVYIGSETTLGSVLYMGSSLCTGITGGETMGILTTTLLLWLFAFIALVGTGYAYAFHKPQIAWVAAIGWALLGFLAYQQSEGGSPMEIVDVYMGMFWMGVVMTIVSGFEPMIMRDKSDEEEVMTTEPMVYKETELQQDYKRLQDEVNTFRPKRRKKRLQD